MIFNLIPGLVVAVVVVVVVMVVVIVVVVVVVAVVVVVVVAHPRTHLMVVPTVLFVPLGLFSSNGIAIHIVVFVSGVPEKHG